MTEVEEPEKNIYDTTSKTLFVKSLIGDFDAGTFLSMQNKCNELEIWENERIKIYDFMKVLLYLVRNLKDNFEINQMIKQLLFVVELPETQTDEFIAGFAFINGISTYFKKNYVEVRQMILKLLSNVEDYFISINNWFEDEDKIKKMFMVEYNKTFFGTAHFRLKKLITMKNLELVDKPKN
jgi:hypothetical protein